METYLHSFYTWALAKHGVRVGRAAAIAGAVGAALPDFPSILGTAYYIGPRFLRDGWASMESGDVVEKIYQSGPFGASGVALHSALPVLVLLALYRLLRLGGHDHRRILLWFLIGWMGHTLTDFLTHATDARPLFWPLTDWEWSSPVSYYDPDHHGRLFALASNGLALLTAALLLVKRLLRRRPTGER